MQEKTTVKKICEEKCNKSRENGGNRKKLYTKHWRRKKQEKKTPLN